MKSMRQVKLDRHKTALVVVDFQERLYAAMTPDRREEALKNTILLIEAAKTLGVPILYSEQYPQGLGKTLPAIMESFTSGAKSFQKLEFSCWLTQGFAPEIQQLGVTQAVVTGMECHVCVLQTVLDMIENGISVHIPRDAVVSRTEENRVAGLELMDRAGAVITSAETVIFQLLERAGTPEFKALSKLVK